MIYELVLPQEVDIIPSPYEYLLDQMPAKQPALLRSSRQLREESQAVLYRISTFNIPVDYSTDLIAFKR